MKKNKLTRDLLDAGYTADHYPSNVRLPGGCLNNDPLENIYGGFEYQRCFSDEIVYKTGCGMFVKGINALDNMGMGEITYCHENGNPVIRCPFDKTGCDKNNFSHNDILFGGGLCVQSWCECSISKESYQYENSFERAEKLRQEEKNRKYKEYEEKHGGRVCVNHMCFDERTREWKLSYEPSRCARVCYTQDGYCPILGKQLSRKKGNVYYDLMTCGHIVNHESQISFEDNKEWKSVRKGNRFFKKPVSMDICEAFIKKNGIEEIECYYEVNNGSINRMIDKTWKFEIQNVRAEYKPSRDLEKDLEDIRSGANITYEFEREKKEKIAKKEKRTAAKEKRTEILKKKILEKGYESFPETSLDRVHADKWLSVEEIEELDRLRVENQRKAKENTQLSLEQLFGEKDPVKVGC